MVTYRSRRCDFKVHRFKDEIRRRRQLNNFAAHQTQFLVVVKNSVHVLDPNGIDGTVKYQPFPVRRLRKMKQAHATYTGDLHGDKTVRRLEHQVTSKYAHWNQSSNLC